MNPSPAGLSDAYTALHTIEIPDDWSPTQALAVWELLHDISERIWVRYEPQLVELIRDDLQHEHEDNQLNLFDPNDPIPF